MFSHATDHGAFSIWKWEFQQFVWTYLNGSFNNDELVHCVTKSLNQKLQIAIKAACRTCKIWPVTNAALVIFLTFLSPSRIYQKFSDIFTRNPSIAHQRHLLAILSSKWKGFQNHLTCFLFELHFRHLELYLYLFSNKNDNPFLKSVSDKYLFR